MTKKQKNVLETKKYNIVPYIKKEDRKDYDDVIIEIVNRLLGKGPKDSGVAVVGDVNYVISSIIWKLFDTKMSYTNGNNLVGVLECVKQEFYRRKLIPYENEKIVEHGDI